MVKGRQREGKGKAKGMVDYKEVVDPVLSHRALLGEKIR